MQPRFGADDIAHLRGRGLGFLRLPRRARGHGGGPQSAALQNGAASARSEWPRSLEESFCPTTAPAARSPRMALSHPRPTAGSAGLPALGSSPRGQEVLLHPPPDRPQGPRGHVPDLGRQRQRTRTGSAWRETPTPKNHASRQPSRAVPTPGCRKRAFISGAPVCYRAGARRFRFSARSARCVCVCFCCHDVGAVLAACPTGLPSVLFWSLCEIYKQHTKANAL